MFEIHVGELRATFLRNHNMRRHKGATKCPKRKTTQAQKTTQAEDAHIPGNHHKHGGAAPVTWRCTSYVALHPLRGAAPLTWRCTRYVAVHPLCGAAPVTWRCTRTEEVHCLQFGCTAPTHKNKRGTGTPNHSPPHPSMRSWALLVVGRERETLRSRVRPV